MSDEVDLTLYASLIEMERKADEGRRFHEKEAAKFTRARDEIREQLAKLMGSAHVGLVNGKQAMRRTESKQFAKARFAAEYPEMYEEYKVPKLVYEVDTQRLETEQPDVYSQFTTTRWTNSSEVL